MANGRTQATTPAAGVQDELARAPLNLHLEREPTREPLPPPTPEAEREWEELVTDVLGRVLELPDEMETFGICLYVAAEDADDQRSTFAWFEQRSDLLDYVRHVLPFNARRILGDNSETQHALVVTYVDQMEHQRLEADEAADAINGVLEPYCTIEWWGRYLDLVAGVNEFARDLRLWFREQRAAEEGIDGEGGEDAISEEEMDAFHQMLQRYR